MMAKLTAKQELFCREYLVDLNATQAAIRAGYSAKTAGSMGQQLLKKLEIRITEMKAERTERVNIDADYVLGRLVEIDQLDVLDILDDDGCFLPVKHWPKSWRTSLSGLDVMEVASGDTAAVLKKIKWPDKTRNLELLGKHIDVQAFKERSEQEIKEQPVTKIEIEVVRHGQNAKAADDAAPG